MFKSNKIAVTNDDKIIPKKNPMNFNFPNDPPPPPTPPNSPESPEQSSRRSSGQESNGFSSTMDLNINPRTAEVKCTCACSGFTSRIMSFSQNSGKFVSETLNRLRPTR